MSKELDQKTFDYITALEDTNEELLKTLKYSVSILRKLKAAVPNPKEWQKMLDTFNETIKVGERIVGEKTPG